MTMTASRQQGKSLIVTLIFLALIGAGIYLGVQYVPIKMEYGKIDTILDNLDTDHRSAPLSSVNDINERLVSKLNINGMLDLENQFTVRREGDGFLVSIQLERELNLIYEKKPIRYDRTLILN